MVYTIDIFVFDQVVQKSMQNWVFSKRYLVWLNGYPENFIDKCFKKFLDNIRLVKEKVAKVEEKRFLLFLVLIARSNPGYIWVLAIEQVTQVSRVLEPSLLSFPGFIPKVAKRLELGLLRIQLTQVTWVLQASYSRIPGFRNPTYPA